MSITRYKVLGKGRYSFNFSIREILSKRNTYVRKYKKGQIVEADKYSLGIFCFKTEEQAKHYMQNHFTLDAIIVRVKPIGKGIYPKRIGYSTGEDDLKVFYNNLGLDYGIIPEGTICYKSVLVLD